MFLRPIVLGLLASISLVAQAQSGILIEAESFAQKGGWVVDPQFVEQMGSPYLLAHGLGNPVENARTIVAFSKGGNYHAWVRTKNWAPGNWDAPGRFKLIVDGKELKQELGTQPGWNWQYAGKAKISKGETSIELKDLSGFEGRCDAVYFALEYQTPPNTTSELAQWRKKLLNQPEQPTREQSFDLVITGGGIAGCAAAMAAASQGLKVALIHDRPVLGGNASGEIRIHTLGITGAFDTLLNQINTKHWPNGSPEALADDQKRHQNMARYDNISVFLNWRAYTVNTRGAMITSVDARHVETGKTLRLTAPYFVDCTGDGWIGYWAGADYSYGREEASRYNEGCDSMGKALHNDFNDALLRANWSKYKHLWSPDTPDNRVMGSSVLWRTKDSGKPVNFPPVPWAMDVVGTHAAIHGEWYWEYSHNDLNQIDHAEQIRDHLFKAIYGSFYNAKQKPENARIALEWMGYLLGKRESRRLTGDYVYTFDDARRGVRFPDAVVRERRAIDVHYQRQLVDSLTPSFLSDAQYYKLPEYEIPYRSLYSRNIDNLFMAGRCFSCSHIGLGGPRVMNTTGQMGAVVGYATALCKKYSTTPRGIYNDHLDELLSLIGLKQP